MSDVPPIFSLIKCGNDTFPRFVIAKADAYRNAIYWNSETAGLPPELLRDYADMWEVGWIVHPRFSKLLIDGVIYSHGDSGRGGQDAAFQQAKDNFRSTVIGHFHNQAGVRWWANPEFRVFGLSAGCGIDASRMQFEYGRKFAHKPILGCGIVLNGKQAYFEPWLLHSR